MSDQSTERKEAHSVATAPFLAGLETLMRELPGCAAREVLVDSMIGLRVAMRHTLPLVVVISGDADARVRAASLLGLPFGNDDESTQFQLNARSDESGEIIPAWEPCCPVSDASSNATPGASGIDDRQEWPIRIRCRVECAPHSFEQQSPASTDPHLYLRMDSGPGGGTTDSAEARVAVRASGALALGNWIREQHSVRTRFEAQLLKRMRRSAEQAILELNEEVKAVRERTVETGRQKRWADAQDDREGLKVEVDGLKSLLRGWRRASEERIKRRVKTALSYDSRLLSTLLSVDDFSMKEDVAVIREKLASSRMPMLRAFEQWTARSVSQKFVISLGPNARSKIEAALVEHVRRGLGHGESESVTGEVNSALRSLVDQIGKESALYPQLKPLLARMAFEDAHSERFDEIANDVRLELEIDESFTRPGIFKQLAAGRMVANMAFSFVVMLAGGLAVFDATIKKDLRSVAFVVVFLMFAIFGVSFMLRKEEEAKELEETLEKVRDSVSTAGERSLAEAAGQAERVALDQIISVEGLVFEAIEGFAGEAASRRAARVESRKADDEAIRGVLQRRLASLTSMQQRFGQYIASLDKPASDLPRAGAGAISARARLFGTGARAS